MNSEFYNVALHIHTAGHKIIYFVFSQKWGNVDSQQNYSKLVVTPNVVGNFCRIEAQTRNFDK